MKVVVGVSDSDLAKKTAGLLKALKFPKAHIEVVSVIEAWDRTPFQESSAGQPTVFEKYSKFLNDSANGLLADSSAIFSTGEFASVSTALLNGFISNELIDYTERNNADLLALTSSNKGSIEGIMVGSVTRKAVISATRSVLICKGDRELNKPLTVVLATDHSPYANRCIDEFMRLSPQGVGRIVVSTVLPSKLIRALITGFEGSSSEVEGWARRELERANASVVSKLEGVAPRISSRVESGPIGAALELVMKEENADLLVLGAQGHSFSERLLLGSVSLEQAVKKNHSVLIVRVPQPK